MIRRLNTLSNPETAANRLIASAVLTAPGSALLLSGLNLPPDPTKRYLLRAEFEANVGTVAATVLINGSSSNSAIIRSRDSGGVLVSGSVANSMSLTSASAIDVNTSLYGEVSLKYVAALGWVGLVTSAYIGGGIGYRDINSWIFRSAAAITSINVASGSNSYKAGGKLELLEYFGTLS